MILNYRIKVKTYFTTYFGLQSLSASVDTLVCFLQFMARTSGFPHLKHLLASVKFLHNALGHGFPEDNFQLDMSMQGLKRRLAKVPFHRPKPSCVEMNICTILYLKFTDPFNFNPFY